MAACHGVTVGSLAPAGLRDGTRRDAFCLAFSGEERQDLAPCRFRRLGCPSPRARAAGPGRAIIADDGQLGAGAGA